MSKVLWTEAEIVVLCAAFANLDFSAGDDEKGESRRIAKAFGRTSGTVDMQWRNIKKYLANGDNKKIGERVKYWAETTLNRPHVVSRLSVHYCREKDWDLLDLVAEGECSNDKK